MGKAIALFIGGKPQGIFSNKSNAWKCVTSLFNEEDLIVWSEKSEKWLPASYQVIAKVLGRDLRIKIFDKSEEEIYVEFMENKASTHIAKIYIRQFEMNVDVDGNVFKTEHEEVEI